MAARSASSIGAIVLGGLLLAGCMSAGPGACGASDREFFAAIHQFEGRAVQAQDHPYGVCGAIFATDARPEAVAEHYLEQFGRAGWVVSGPDVMDEAGEPGVTSTTTVSGYRDTYQYHVSIFELADGGANVNVMAGDSGQ